MNELWPEIHFDLQYNNYQGTAYLTWLQEFTQLLFVIVLSLIIIVIVIIVSINYYYHYYYYYYYYYYCYCHYHYHYNQYHYNDNIGSILKIQHQRKNFFIGHAGKKKANKIQIKDEGIKRMTCSYRQVLARWQDRHSSSSGVCLTTATVDSRWKKEQKQDINKLHKFFQFSCDNQTNELTGTDKERNKTMK